MGRAPDKVTCYVYKLNTQWLIRAFLIGSNRIHFKQASGEPEVFKKEFRTNRTCRRPPWTSLAHIQDTWDKTLTFLWRSQFFYLGLPVSKRANLVWCYNRNKVQATQPITAITSIYKHELNYKLIDCHKLFNRHRRVGSNSSPQTY